jgi:hypothetical protein
MKESIEMLSNTPFANLVVIGVFVIIALVIMRWLGIKSIGPVKLGFEDQDSMASLNKTIDESDANLRERMRAYVGALGGSIESGIKSSSIASFALSGTLRNPLYESINNNHFTTVLMSDCINNYKNLLFMQLEDHYRLAEQKANGAIPPFDEKKELVIDWRDRFIEALKGEVLITCKEKLRNYENYNKNITSPRWKEIIKECIEKNESVIKELEK